MEKKELSDFMLDGNWKNFFLFMDTENLGSGENVYHHCKHCKYETHHIENINSEFMEKIDNSAVEHIWKEHRSIAERLYREFRSDAIASAPGQQRLL